MTDQQNFLDKFPDRPNGPVAASLVAAGLGSAAIGIFTVLAEASEPIKNSLNWWDPAGPLTGKALGGVILFFVSWLVLHLAFRGKNVNFTRAATLSFILLFIALLFTFPPFFELFAIK